MRRTPLVLALTLACGCGGGGGGSGGGATTSDTLYGDPHAGEYHLGPVEWEGSYWNSCGPYTDDVEALEGGFLAGVGLDFNGGGELCDACILVTADTGKTVVARVVTTGVTNGPNDLDLSQAAYDALTTGEYPRAMQWQLAKCPDTGTLRYQWQEGANEWWTSLWVRNPRVPLSQVLVKSANHADFTPLERGGDGTLTDGGGFGAGAFTLRVEGLDGDAIEEELPSFTPGSVVTSSLQLE